MCCANKQARVACLWEMSSSQGKAKPGTRTGCRVSSVAARAASIFRFVNSSGSPVQAAHTPQARLVDPAVAAYCFTVTVVVGFSSIAGHLLWTSVGTPLEMDPAVCAKTLTGIATGMLVTTSHPGTPTEERVFF